MEKKDILKKAQYEHVDEYEDNIRSDAKSNVREVVDVILFCAAIYFQFYNEQMITIVGAKVAISDLCFLPCFLYETLYYGTLYKKMKIKKYLYYGLFWLLAVIAIFVV